MIGNITDISKFSTNNEIQIYPNPSTGVINISVPENMSGLDISIVNVQGLIISEFKSAGKGTHRADLGKSGKGVYFIRIAGNQGISVEKAVIR
jgi:hypothetical protein